MQNDPAAPATTSGVDPVAERRAELASLQAHADRRRRWRSGIVVVVVVAVAVAAYLAFGRETEEEADAESVELTTTLVQRRDLPARVPVSFPAW